MKKVKPKRKIVRSLSKPFDADTYETHVKTDNSPFEITRGLDEFVKLMLVCFGVVLMVSVIAMSSGLTADYHRTYGTALSVKSVNAGGHFIVGLICCMVIAIIPTTLIHEKRSALIKRELYWEMLEGDLKEDEYKRLLKEA